MTEFLFQYGLFLAKAVTLVAAIGALAMLITSLVHSMRAHSADHLAVKSLNHRFRDLADSVRHATFTRAEWKRELKAHKAEDKARGKAGSSQRPRVFVLDFDGDLQATPVASLRDEISAVLQVARDGDEVLMRLESAGGVVHGYGLAASQLQRVRDRKVRLTVAVDKVAASGGYLMACVADRILAAPFAVVGSIGVVGQLPNFHRLLKKHDVEYELHTAGEHKRTLTVFGENTDEGRAKFQEQLEEAHTLFKDFIRQNRPQVDLAQVATGDHWFGTRALELKLVDELKTSDDWLLERSRDRDLYELRYKRHRGLAERLGAGLTRLRATLLP
ncbi:MAG TPA: protease SohB [Verrucomicrobiae bacterium]|nr:protease SohB [Verrucomicrobiae bacterium]